MTEKKQATRKTTKSSDSTKTGAKKTAAKKTAPKKPVKKAVISDDVEKIINDEPIAKQENKSIEEQINSVNTEIEPSNKVAEIEEKINREIEPIIEISKEVDDVVNSKDEFEKNTTTMNTAELKNYTEQQLNKAVSLKERLKNILSRSKNNRITGWWNGTGYNE
jgi:hypothetical protein